MRLFKPGFFVRLLYPEAFFRIRTTEKLLYLTFDDGPDPGSTPELLKILNKYNIKALFFCSGSAAEKYSDITGKIIGRGHLIGNHGYNHLNGWTTSLIRYIDDVKKAAPLTSSFFFRPPYGRLRISQYLRLKKKYKIIFWDIMPYDFDPAFEGKNSLHILKKKIRPGSIIVFHDTQKSNAPEFIEDFILFALNEGYKFDTLVHLRSTRRSGFFISE